MTPRIDPAPAPAISLRQVSKKYHLYDSLSHRIYEALHPFKKKYHREFWALREVSLDIPRGATVGILGVNGSGKSTLLQLICSILHPTSGTIEVNGKVAALIELGAGFNPDLTGRENVEVNCAIMGLDARAIRERLPQIEAFADIGEFFDQPVKTYSSGMFMRVAFSTAISVDPEILVIDEALAVGDAKFQQKCFRKFRDFQSAGKTILLVTHDRSAVPRLCSYGVLLHKGRLLHAGPPKEVTDHYTHLLTHGEDSGAAAQPGGEPTAASAAPVGADPGAVRCSIERFESRTDEADRCPLNPTYNKNEFSYGLGGARIVDYMIRSGDAINPVDVDSGASVEVLVKVRFSEPVEHPLVGMSVKTREGALIYGTHSGWLGARLAARAPGEVATYKFRVRLSLGADDWFLDLAVARNQSEVMHAREGLIHIKTVAPRMSTGIVDLDTSVSEA